jgi:hypothetical protein
LVYEDIIRAAKPFVFSEPPLGLEGVTFSVRWIIRYNEAKKALIADYMAKTRQVEATIKAEKRMAKLAKLSKATNPSGPSEQTTPPAIDYQELRSIISTYVVYADKDYERDELEILANRYLQQDPQSVQDFKIFTRMLRTRKKR